MYLARACGRSVESQAVPHGLDRVPAVGDLVLLLADHLRVGAVADVGVGDEDGVVAEAVGAAWFGGEGAVHGSLEYLDSCGVGVAECGGDGRPAVGQSCGHVQDACGPTVSRNQATSAPGRPFHPWMLRPVSSTRTGSRGGGGGWGGLRGGAGGAARGGAPGR